MYRLLEWAFAYDDGSGLPDAGAYAAELKNVAATADGKPIAGFDPTRDGAYKVAAGAKVRISDVPSDWKLDKTESGSKLVFTASKGGTAVTWTFEYQANGGSSATDPGNGGGSNAGGDGQGDPGKTPDTSKPVFCQVGVGRFGVSFSPCERRVSGRFGVGRSCWLLVIALVIA